MKSILTFIAKALQEDNGNPSSLRLNNYQMVTLFTLAMTFGFIWTVLHHPDLVLGYLTVLASLIAAATGLKVFQKGKEQKVDESTPIEPGAPAQ